MQKPGMYNLFQKYDLRAKFWTPYSTTTVSTNQVATLCFRRDQVASWNHSLRAVKALVTGTEFTLDVCIRPGGEESPLAGWNHSLRAVKALVTALQRPSPPSPLPLPPPPPPADASPGVADDDGVKAVSLLLSEIKGNNIVFSFTYFFLFNFVIHFKKFTQITQQILQNERFL